MRSRPSWSSECCSYSSSSCGALHSAVALYPCPTPHFLHPCIPCRRESGTSQQHFQQQQQQQQPQHLASKADIAARCKPQLAWAVAVLFLLLPFLEHHIDPPQVVWKLLLVGSECRA